MVPMQKIIVNKSIVEEKDESFSFRIELSSKKGSKVV
jgi:hypothetical protein